MRSEWEFIEQIVARRIGGTLTPGSGSGKRKGDVHCGEWMVEVKHTRHPSKYVLNTKVLDGLVQNSRVRGMRPCLVIWLGGLASPNVTYIIPQRFYRTPNQNAPRSITLHLPAYGTTISSKLAEWILIEETEFIGMLEESHENT